MKKITLVLTVLGACLSCTPKTSGPSFDEVLTSRRSIRNFDSSKTISESEIREIILAAQDAPSWANSQSTRYYVALSKEKTDAVRGLIREQNQKNTEGASAFVVSTFVKGQSGYFRGTPSNELGDGWGAYDNGLSNAYFILKARAMDFDTLIMGGRDADGIRALFNIPEEETVMAVIALGYRASDPDRPGRKDLDEIVKFF